METIFTTCVPRPEVLSGDLRDEMFAARLRDVIDGTADPVYGDARTFFRNTWPTEGLKTLLAQVCGRLSGEAKRNVPFIRLETSFGGGKTHNLIALWHAARGPNDALPKSLVKPEYLAQKPWTTIGLVGSDLDPANGILHDGLRTRTIWGEMAWQAGKMRGNPTAAYEVLRASDEQLAAPGTQAIQNALGEGPVLVMLDEMGRYLRAAKAISTANRQSDLAAQTVAFLMSLIEFAASRDNTVVVITLADPQADAYADETTELSKAFGEAQTITARQALVLTPSNEKEIAPIVAHRLFESVDPKAGKEVTSAYSQHYAHLAEQGVEFRGAVLTAAYSGEFERSYPFHPEFLATLNRKTATIPNFQKTRGALRLLARVVRSLWQSRPKDAFVVSTHHLELADQTTLDDLTSRLDRPAFRSVAQADIASPQKGMLAHAQVVDRLFLEAGHPPYANRIATTVFLHSLAQKGAGIEPGDLRVSVLQPGDDPGHFDRAISVLTAETRGEPGSACWYLHWDGFRYCFKTEPSLEKMIQDETGLVGKLPAKNDLDDRIRKVWQAGALKPVFFPSEPSSLADDAKEPKLAILHYDAAAIEGADEEVPSLVRRLFDHAGTIDAYRSFKNNVLFLVADAAQIPRLVDMAQRQLTIRRLLDTEERLRDFSEEQKKRLRTMADAAELDVRIGITKTYRHLFYPATNAGKDSGGLTHELLPPQDQGKATNQTPVVVSLLRNLKKIQTSDDPDLAPAYVRARAWPQGAPSVGTEDLRRVFARNTTLPMLPDPQPLKKAIREGCRMGIWVYFPAAEQVGYGQGSPAPHVQLIEDDILYLPDEAVRLGIRIKGVTPAPEETAKCPLCGHLPCTCATDDAVRDTEPGRTVRPKPAAAQTGPRRFLTDGLPAQAFKKLADVLVDKKVAGIARLWIRVSGTDAQAAKDSKLMGLAVPQLGIPTMFVRHHLSAAIQGTEKARLEVTFEGPWDRYRAVKDLTGDFGEKASQVTVETGIEAVFKQPLAPDGSDFDKIRDLFDTIEIHKVQLEAEEAGSAGREDA